MEKNDRKRYIIAKKAALCFCLVMTTLCFVPISGYGTGYCVFQDVQKRVTVSLSNATLEQILSEINKQTGVNYGFQSNGQVDKNRRFTLQVKDVTVEKALNALLGDSPYTFTYEKNRIVIVAKASNDTVVCTVCVTGKVTDAKGNPLPGVTVKVTGVPLGTATDHKGSFAMDLPLEKGVLEFSFIGFKTKQVSFTKQTDTLRVVLEEDVANLDEVVVVGYGETTRRKSTGAISVVKADELKGIPTSNIANLLQGRVAGMDITQMSGSPGGGGTAIVIRGYNSLDVEQGRRFSDPLWVVDGVPLNSFSSPITGTNLLSDLNPDMIESIQILKDASSASIYGSRAANGVIIVTTKKGKKNQDATFAVNASYTYSYLPELPTVTTGRAERLFRLEQVRKNYAPYVDPQTNIYKYPTTLREQYDYQNSSFDGNFIPNPFKTTNGTMYQDSLNSFYNNSTNFFPMYYVKGKVTNANLQTYGGSERMFYGIGLGFYDEKGIFKGTGYSRIDLNSSMNVTPVKRLNVDMRLNASLTKRKRATSSEYLGAAPSVETVPGEPYELSSVLPGEGSVVWNSVLENYKATKEKNRGIRLRANFKLGYEVIDGLNLSSSLSADYSIERRNYFTPSFLNWRGFSNSLGETGINLMVLNENILSFKRTIRENHNINFVAGFSYQWDQTEYNGGNAMNSPSDKIHYAPGGMPNYTVENPPGSASPTIVVLKNYQSDMQEKVLMSYFARLEYGYKDKYLLSASVRRDGSSTFGENRRWGTFPSVAAGWTFSEESFVKDYLSWLSFGKLRASWGRSGMHFSSNYLALGLMQIGGNGLYLGNTTITPVWGDGLYNDDLTWEETDQYDFGLDVDLFDYRLCFTLDYYYRYTDKLLAQINLPGDHNGYAMQWRNTAAISNEGIELLVKYEIFRKPDLYWKISVNGARNWNRFEKSYDGKDFGGRIIGKPLNGLYAVKTDGYIDSYDETKLYYNQSGIGSYLGKPGDYNLVDINGDGMVGYDRVYVGSTLPTVSGGVVNEFRWKNFDLNMLFAYSIGRHMYNETIKRTINSPKYYPALVYDLADITFWEKPGDHADYPLYSAAGFPIVDRDVEKVNYLKLKTLSVGYSLPKKWSKKMGMNECRLFVSGENLWTWTNYSGMDPETTDIRGGITGYVGGNYYPLARKFTVGLTLKF